ncbi:MAG TPA: YSC84-related protein [Verrucomicrobiae bacterium]|nr:YSC84-related protein [Verrucomicrobiae bacterium]
MKTTGMVRLLVTLALAGGVATATTAADRLDTDVRDTIQMIRTSNPRLQRLFDTAYGYAVFPSVGKGGIGLGGAEGRGQVFEKGALVGTAKLTQATVGAQLGAQSYSEVIFFESPKALDDFRDGKTALSADLSGALAADGAGAEAKYQHGVLVYTMQRSGLMFEASIGGQHFTFTPIDTGGPAPTSTESAPAGTSTPPAAPPPPASHSPAQ